MWGLSASTKVPSNIFAENTEPIQARKVVMSVSRGLLANKHSTHAPRVAMWGGTINVPREPLLACIQKEIQPGHSLDLWVLPEDFLRKTQGR